MGMSKQEWSKIQTSALVGAGAGGVGALVVGSLLNLWLIILIPLIVAGVVTGASLGYKRGVNKAVEARSGGSRAQLN